MKVRRAWRNQRGVAMVTVLFIGAALTVVASSAAFVSIREFRATRDDRAGSQSLAFAEAGIDRMMLKIRDGTVTWSDISAAGCTISDEPYPVIEITGTIGGPAQTYTTRLMKYNPGASGVSRFPPDACSSVSRDPKGLHHFVIESIGQQPAARRVIRQVVAIRPLGLPVGIYAIDHAMGTGSVTMNGLSMITPGTIERRDDFMFINDDAYYTVHDFFGNSVNTPIPAAAHALGQITYGPASKLLEHRGDSASEPNCDANRGDNTTRWRSLWDSSGTAQLSSLGSPPYCASVNPQTVGPPNARFTTDNLKNVAPNPELTAKDYQTLAEAAKAYGVYCSGPNATTGKLTCIRLGQVEDNVDRTIENNSPVFSGMPTNNFIAYFDLTGPDAFSGGQTITWKKRIEPCSDTPADHRSIVLIVRNGSLSSEGGNHVVGAMLVPDGVVTTKGGFTLEGTIIARRFDVRGGAAFSLTGCAVRNLPGPFLDATPTTWSEVDR